MGIGTAAQLIAANPGDEPATIVAAIGAAISGLFRASHPSPSARAARGRGKSDSLDGALDQLVEAVAGYLRSRPELRVDPASAAFTIVHAVDSAINAFAIRQPIAAPLDDPDTMARDLARMVDAYLGLA
ncbi:MAG: hypothetical protein HOV81_31560 [Kofleriaceae bacterium]|nr:hypothetical protein [Kofleriaceae bacterium]